MVIVLVLLTSLNANPSIVKNALDENTRFLAAKQKLVSDVDNCVCSKEPDSCPFPILVAVLASLLECSIFYPDVNSWLEIVSSWLPSGSHAFDPYAAVLRILVLALMV